MIKKSSCLDVEGRKQSSNRFLWSQGRALGHLALYREGNDGGVIP